MFINNAKVKYVTLGKIEFNYMYISRVVVSVRFMLLF